MLITAIISIVVFGAVPVWLAAVVVGREVLVSATVLVLASLGAARIDVNWFGKAGTFGLMCAFPLFVLAHGPGGWTRGVEHRGLGDRHPGARLLLLGGAVLRAPAAPRTRRRTARRGRVGM